jgi:protein SCO1
VSNKSFFLSVAAVAAAILIGFSLRAVKPRPSPPPPQLGQVPDFELTDASGRKVRRDDLRGPWLADFIFTRCGDQCPLMTERMAELREKLPGVRFVSFSVDPADKPADLARFASQHGADWTFLTGGPGIVQKLSSEGFKLAAVEGKDSSSPIIHSGYFVLVDADYRIRGYYDFGDEAALAKLESAARDLTAGTARAAGATAAAR